MTRLWLGTSATAEGVVLEVVDRVSLALTPDHADRLATALRRHAATLRAQKTVLPLRAVPPPAVNLAKALAAGAPSRRPRRRPPRLRLLRGGA